MVLTDTNTSEVGSCSSCAKYAWLGLVRSSLFGDCEAMILRSSGISLVLVLAVALYLKMIIVESTFY